MTVHLKATVGGDTEHISFVKDDYELHDKIFELDAKQELIRVMQTEFLLIMMKEFGYEIGSAELDRTFDFIQFLENKAGLSLNWKNSMTIDGKEYDFVNKTNDDHSRELFL